MEYKIKTVNYDGTVTEVKVSVNVYNYDKENFWQEDWRNRKSKSETSYEELFNIYGKNGLPHELQEESNEIKFIENYNYKQLHKAINKLPKAQRRRVILRYFYHMSLSRIAEIEGINKVSFKTSIDRALKQLKNMSNDFLN